MDKYERYIFRIEMMRENLSLLSARASNSANKNGMRLAKEIWNFATSLLTEDYNNDEAFEKAQKKYSEYHKSVEELEKRG